MALDMSQFYQVFFEETAEHLANLEAHLLEVDRENPDSELLNAIFRAAHSIKGSSGTFGFNDMMEVTHVLETLLDRIRKGELALTEEMVDVFLQARDVLGNLLAAHQGDAEADLEAVAVVCERLERLTTDSAAAGAGAVESESASFVPERADNSAAIRSVELSFSLPAGAPQSSIDSVIKELEIFGPVEVLSKAVAVGQPWRLSVASGAELELIKDVLDFVAEPSSIQISASAQVRGDQDGAYGFFGTDVEPVAEETAYGFFSDPSASLAQSPAPSTEKKTRSARASSTPEPKEAYGFFDSEPVPTESGSNGDADPDPQGAYGFFGALPQPVPDEEPVKQPGRTNKPAGDVTPGDPKGAYGFFTTVPKPVDTVPEPVAKPAPSVAKVVEQAVVPSEAKSAKVETAGAAAPNNGNGDKAKSSGGKSAAVAKAAADSSTIRVGVEKVDQMINLVGELVITQAMLTQAASKLDPVQFERLMNGLAQLERNTRDLQESVMSIRMLPISMVFSRFPRVVRDLSQKLGKQVELKLSGESTELDKSLIERITDPLTHLIRNSLDHGIEPTDVRLEKGKPPVGTISLSASHQSGNIVIEVGDDGAGLNREKILSKAKSRGLPIHEGMSDQEVWQLIFEAGFSTADQVTEVSGRGVGMDVVKRNITAMGGRVEIQSMFGVGTRMTVRLPLTLAILDGMSVAVGQENYIIPLNYVIESLQPKKSMIKTVSGVQRLIQVRGEYLPVIALHEVFGIKNFTEDIENAIMVVLEADGTKAALLVDALVGQHQVVIKSLEANYRKVNGVSGATIMGDGHVALILDVGSLVSMARHQVAA